jgi:hypothetical protein
LRAVEETEGCGENREPKREQMAVEGTDGRGPLRGHRA